MNFLLIKRLKWWIRLQLDLNLMCDFQQPSFLLQALLQLSRCFQAQSIDFSIFCFNIIFSVFLESNRFGCHVNPIGGKPDQNRRAIRRHANFIRFLLIDDYKSPLADQIILQFLQPLLNS
jgi:hypothetical protein